MIIVSFSPAIIELPLNLGSLFLSKFILLRLMDTSLPINLLDFVFKKLNSISLITTKPEFVNISVQYYIYP